VQKILKV